MNVEVLADADAVARRGAAVIAADARAAVAARGRFVVAVSGGRTPWEMLRVLAREDVPWANVHVMQTDERVAPQGHVERNLTHLRACLEVTSLPPGQLHAMPVEDSDLEAAVIRYSRVLGAVAGSPPVIDLVHLGLGPDGHTASLMPDDSVLDVHDADVALTGVYQGRRRMTLTYPSINRARRILWVVTGREKSTMLARLRTGDRTVPAGRVVTERALLLADRDAGELRLSVT